MTALATRLPVRRPELVIRPLGDAGRYVVKDPSSGDYFHLGPQEHFLLTQLDGEMDAERVCQAFSERFGEHMSEAELQAFVDLAEQRGFLARQRNWPLATPRLSDQAADLTSERVAAAPRRQSLLYWRRSLFDPDRLITWLEPKLRFIWTPAALIFSATCIVFAVFIVLSSGSELVTRFPGVMHWETLVLAWLALLVVTALHEFAHGLTCKHYGGEVHEIGFLLMFFMPCFYCNVSDAWLFREKSKRLWVTFAGGYCELFVWALAVFSWRLTTPDNLPNYLAFVVLAVCGVQSLFNFNPLLKLDGYYLLSDWLEIPNLQQRSWHYVTARVRWLLWGASRPAREPSGRVLRTYGLASWLYSLIFLALMLCGFFQFLWSSWGWVGLAGFSILTWITLSGIFRGFSNGEVGNMIHFRHKRTAAWVLLLGMAGLALHRLEIEDRSSGPFQTRPATRAELRAEVAGFLREIAFDEGDRVATGSLIARLDVPDLSNRIIQKRAEVREAEATLRLLEAGPRTEEVDQQRARVERLKEWRDLGRQDLVQARQALQEELSRLDKQIDQHQADVNAAKETYQRTKNIRGKGIPEEQFLESERRYQVALAVLAQSEFQKRHREALGTRDAIAGFDAEAELARREKDVADAQSTLTVLEAGGRPEEIEAQRARLDRLREDVSYWESVQKRLLITSPVAALITTPHLKEKMGQYVREGDLICVVEEPSTLELEITVCEQDSARIQPGQVIELKARSLPFQTMRSTVSRVSPRAARRDQVSTSPTAADLDVPSQVTVYCTLANSASELRPGMTGYARISTGQRPFRDILLDRVLRWLRTEFWW